jgi:hypothetical protein
MRLFHLVKQHRARLRPFVGHTQKPLFAGT